MSDTNKTKQDLIISDYRHTGFARTLRILALIVCVVYVAILVYFLVFSVAGLFLWEYVLLLCFSAAPVLLMIYSDVMPYIEYDRFRKSLTKEEYRHFLDEYALNKNISGTKDGIIVDDRIVFFMGKISVPKMSDIVWLYTAGMGNLGRSNIIFISKLRKFYITTILSGDEEKITDRYIWQIRQHSPELMVGDTEENDRIYTEKYEKNKKMHKKP